MPTAAELLNGVNEVDKTLVVDNSFRTIKIPSSVPNLGVEYDDDVLRLDFKMPRYVSGTDLSTFPIRINYINAKGESDVYTVRDFTVSDQYITFSWLVGPTATRYAGDTKFNICLKKIDSEGYIEQEFNTTVATLPVLEGLEVDEGMVAQYSDIIEQWRRELFGIGDTEETSMRAVSQAEQKAIENKGAEVLATIPVDYQTAVSMTRNAERTKADAIICSAVGDIIAVADSSDDYLRGLRIFGKTAQVSTTGKQLLNVSQETNTSNGITFTKQADGSIHVKGTATAEAYFIFDSNNPIPVKETELAATLKGSDKVYMIVGYFKDDGTVVNSIATVDNKTVDTFVYPAEAYTTRTFIGINAGVSVDDTVYPMIRLASNPNEDYEPYSGGVASPRPEWPQSLVSIENPTIGIYGKNLLKIVRGGTTVSVTETVNNGAVSFSGTATGSGGRTSFKRSDDFMLYPGTYTLKMNVPSGTAPQGCLTQSSQSAVIAGTLSSDPSQPKVFTIKEPMSVYFGFNYLTGVTYDASNVTVQIEMGDTASDYEHPKDIQTSTIHYTLPAIPVSKGGIYTDSNGQQWVCDEIDFERGVYIQRTHTITFNGTESWYISAAQYSSGTRFDVNVSGVPSALSQEVLCDRFAFKGANAGVETAWVLADNAGFRVITEIATTVDEFTAFLSDNPTTMIYVIKTPIETPLTPEEIEWFRSTHTNFHNTTVFNDAGAMMELKYNADTKTWLNKYVGDFIQLKDQSTGKPYKLYVNNGKLMMDTLEV